MQHFVFVYVLITTSLFLMGSCNPKQPKPVDEGNQPVPVEESKAPDFAADSAYIYIEKQVDFGPRVLNTKAHENCGDYLIAQMKSFGAKVIEQKAELRAFNGDKLNARNIIGVFNEKQEYRILLFAHWDSRPFADQDPDPEKHNTPIDGANDGAGGVGVLMEIARQIGMKAPEVGVDIIFFDAEDMGAPQSYEGDAGEETWCLGSQYWAVQPHVKGYMAKFGILLDMVGAKDAFFLKEGFSVQYANRYVEKVWQKAASIGYGKYFINEKGGYITDDHLYVNQLAGIPSIDIIQSDKTTRSGFYEHWHTTNDTMDFIDKETLKAVGQTVMEVIYSEKVKK
ncbi:MAG: M28 family peptidase [Candidatus Azobacteroides sp.]|nr:M28 family peptidase [Candidatus Azobacteroides sp.]